MDKAEIPPPPAATEPLVALILQDGVVTEAELQRATFAVIQCLDEQGIEHTEPVWVDEGDVPQWDFLVFTPMKSEDAAPSSKPTPYDLCYQTYQQAVANQWAEQHRPSEREVQQRNIAFLSCLRQEVGIDLDDVAAFAGQMAHLPPEQQRLATGCMRRTLGGVKE